MDDLGTAILVALSPYVVAGLRRDEWPDAIMTLVSIGVVAVFFVFGQWIGNLLLWPLTEDFWKGLLAAWASQQLLYKLVLKDSGMIERLESFGNIRPGSKKDEEIDGRSSAN